MQGEAWEDNAENWLIGRMHQTIQEPEEDS